LENAIKIEEAQMDGAAASSQKKRPLPDKGVFGIDTLDVHFLCYYFRRAFQSFGELKARFSVLSPNCFMVSQITKLRKTAVLYT
jgi:hypothetical protein